MRTSPLSDAALLRFDPFAGDKDDAGARNSSRRVVRTRGEHSCLYGRIPHDIPAGSRAVMFQAIVDRKWRRFWICADCIEKEKADG